MDKQIKNPVTYELRSVIRFLNVKNTKLAGIYCRIYKEYGLNAMSIQRIENGCDFSMKAVQTFIG